MSLILFWVHLAVNVHWHLRQDSLWVCGTVQWRRGCAHWPVLPGHFTLAMQPPCKLLPRARGPWALRPKSHNQHPARSWERKKSLLFKEGKRDKRQENKVANALRTRSIWWTGDAFSCLRLLQDLYVVWFLFLSIGVEFWHVVTSSGRIRGRGAGRLSVVPSVTAWASWDRLWPSCLRDQSVCSQCPQPSPEDGA